VILLAAKEAAAGPDWAVVLTAIGTVVGAAVLATSAGVAWFQLKDAKITRHGQLMVELGKRWDAVYYPTLRVFAKHTDREIRRMLDRLFGADAPEGSDVEDWLTLLQLLNLIEEIADFRRYKALTIEAVDVIWGDRIISVWRQWSAHVHHLRRILRADPKIASPNAYEDFQRLAVELRLRRRPKPKPAYRGLPAAVALAAGYTESGDFRPFDPPV
jgi:hypothetical protein